MVSNPQSATYPNRSFPGPVGRSCFRGIVPEFIRRELENDDENKYIKGWGHGYRLTYDVSNSCCIEYDKVAYFEGFYCRLLVTVDDVEVER